MTRAACYIFDPKSVSAGTDGDAIVSCGDFSIEDRDGGGRLNVDTIGVGAVSGS